MKRWTSSTRCSQRSPPGSPPGRTWRAPATEEASRHDRARGARSPLLVEAAGLQLAVTAGPFPDADPARAGAILLIRDLSAEAEAERVKRDFVSMVGHELRTPLTLIRTTIDLLHSHDAGDLNPTQQRIVEVLLQNSDRLMSLISDLLDMSALDSGRMQITPPRSTSWMSSTTQHGPRRPPSRVTSTGCAWSRRTR